MKPAGLLLPFVLVATLPAAEPSSPPAKAEAKPAVEAPAMISPQMSQLLTDKFPKYDPPAPAKPEAAPDPDLLQLPKMTVTQKKRPRLGDNVMMTTKAFNEKLAKEKTSSFDRNFLNRYSWLGGASAEARAREEYEYEQRQQLLSDVARMARVIELEDPAKAKALRDAASKP